MTFEETLDLYLRARFTLIIVVTPEEERVLDTVKTLCEQTKRSLFSWDVADAFKTISADGKGGTPGGRDPISALDHIAKVTDNAVFA